jgi:hypothetical protein
VDREQCDQKNEGIEIKTSGHCDQEDDRYAHDRNQDAGGKIAHV